MDNKHPELITQYQGVLCNVMGPTNCSWSTFNFIEIRTVFGAQRWWSVSCEPRRSREYSKWISDCVYYPCSVNLWTYNRYSRPIVMSGGARKSLVPKGQKVVRVFIGLITAALERCFKIYTLLETLCFTPKCNLIFRYFTIKLYRINTAKL